MQYVDALIEDLLSFQPSAQQLLAQLQEKVLLSQQAAAAEAQKFSGTGKQGEGVVLHRAFAVILLTRHWQQRLSRVLGAWPHACFAPWMWSPQGRQLEPGGQDLGTEVFPGYAWTVPQPEEDARRLRLHLHLGMDCCVVQDEMLPKPILSHCTA